MLAEQLRDVVRELVNREYPEVPGLAWDEELSRSVSYKEDGSTEADMFVSWTLAGRRISDYSAELLASAFYGSWWLGQGDGRQIAWFGSDAGEEMSTRKVNLFVYGEYVGGGKSTIVEAVLDAVQRGHL